jgi:hypothetical protein
MTNRQHSDVLEEYQILHYPNFLPLSSETIPALRPTYPMGAGGPFPWVKHGHGVTLTTHPI